MAAKFLDKILFVLSVVLAGGAFWLAAHQQEQAREVLDLRKQATKFSAYVPKDVKVVTDPAQVWVEPKDQSSGPTWIYEIFTSPYLRIFHDEITASPPIPTRPEAPFGLVYEGIKPDLFRLQLVGVQGQDVIFWNVRDNKVVFARGSMKLPDLDVDILNIQMKQVEIGSEIEGGGRRATVVVPHATLLDTKTNTRLEVSLQEKAMSGEPFAVLKSNPGRKKDQKITILPPMKAGATFEENGVTYHVDSVSGEPTPSIVVTKMVPGGNITKTLAPKPKALPSPDKARPVTADKPK